VGLGVGVRLAGVPVAVGVGVGVSVSYWKAQVNSADGVMQQVIVSGRICIGLRPGTAGEVSKWKVTVTRSDTVNEFAPMLLTRKPLGWTTSTGQLICTMKSVGAVETTLPQKLTSLIEHFPVGVVVGVGVGVDCCAQYLPPVFK
jgi:hypothetical protein